MDNLIVISVIAAAAAALVIALALAYGTVALVRGVNTRAAEKQATHTGFLTSLLAMLPQLMRSTRGGSVEAVDDAAAGAVENIDAMPATDVSNYVYRSPSTRRQARGGAIRRTIVLPMCSRDNIPPNTSAQISTTTKSTAFRPTRIIVGGNPAHWIVNILKIGNRDQGVRELPGEMFAAAATGMFISAETIQTAMEISVTVTYVGPREQGEPFSCGIVGEAGTGRARTQHR